MHLLHLKGESKKYFKRGELLAKEEEEYLMKYGHKEENTSPQKNTDSGELIVAKFIVSPKNVTELNFPFCILQQQHPQTNRINNFYLDPK